jgi:hypothetical protein
MVELRRGLLVRFACGLAIFLASAPARAQLHWDASAQAGVEKRFLAHLPSGGHDPGFGPTAQLTGHVALLPLVRVGGWIAHDISPMHDPIAARDVTSGGLRVKLMSPFPRGDLRAWLFAGFGYAGVYARSYHATIAQKDPVTGAPLPVDALVQGAGGSFFEVPLGIGASYKLRKPWELAAELGLHLGFGHGGSVYEAPGPQLSYPGTTRPDDNAGPAGIDRVAIGLTVGVMLDL